MKEAARVFRAEVTGMDKLAGDASDRQFYRLLFNGKPESAIMMKLAKPESGPDLPYIAIGRYFKEIGLPVPEIYHYDGQHGFLFLQDSGEKSLFDEMAATGYERSYYQQAIDLLLLLQGEGSRRCDKNWLSLAFDEEKFLWELNFFVEHTIEGYLKQSISNTDRSAFQQEFKNLIRPVLAPPMVLTHRDYHSRNLLLDNGHLTIIDFQDARWGPCQYDLASLLRDSYVKLTEEEVTMLVEYYLERRQQHGNEAIDRENFRRLFDWMSVQRNLKAIGTFTSQLNLRQNDFYLRFIPPTAAYVRENCRKYRELEPLAELLSQYKVLES
jgi:aminoglycoside/choline kinase family phosphotransferase